VAGIWHVLLPRQVPWVFGQQAVDVYRKYAGLRYRLIPYIYNQALAVREEDTLIHRPVFYDYPSDLNAAGLDTQYLFGKELMVIPVLNEDNSESIFPGVSGRIFTTIRLKKAGNGWNRWFR
jgi:alpha-glucosidase (family GH31 glycosyl hydrolase)